MISLSDLKDIGLMLFEDLRIDEDGFSRLNAEDILQIGEGYHCNNLYYLMKYLKRSQLFLNEK